MKDPTGVSPQRTKARTLLYQKCRYAQRRLATVGILTWFLVPNSAWSKDLKDVPGLTYQRFKSLVMHQVGEIPELKSLWNAQKTNGFKVEFGGGRFRILLKWIYTELQSHTYQEVWNMAPPSIEKLVSFDGTDYDLTAPKFAIHQIRAIPEFSKWDLIDYSYVQESIRAGGSTLDKVRASPSQIVDPDGGLHQYWEGRLVYKVVPESVFLQTSLARDGHRQVDTALRFERQSVEQEHLRVDPSSQEFIRSLPTIEKDILGSDSKYVVKALERLYLASGQDFVVTFEKLRDSGLLQFLSEKEYKISIQSGALKPDTFARLSALHPTIPDLQAMMKICSLKGDDSLMFLFEYCLTLSQQ